MQSSAKDMGERFVLNDWRICAALDPHPNALMRTLLSVEHWLANDGSDSGRAQVKMQPLVDWLRGCGVLRGSSRQQHLLMHAFLQTVYGLLDVCPDQWLEADGGELECCGQYFPPQDEGKPASEPDEEQEEMDK